ncbi:MAG TPA: hypothetical protein DEP87_01255 [Candidatus Pacebacteria bacterium]|nr:hypothetical protein [Candidatus Paceibacterota bacterium]
MNLKIFVGSANPAKIKAAEQAVTEVLGEAKKSTFQIIGHEVNSGVAAQPMSDITTKTGSINRAKNVLAWGLAQNSNNCSQPVSILALGLEGGVFQVRSKSHELWSTVWVTLIDSRLPQKLIQVNGARFRLPDQIAQPILAGEEMGEVVGKLAQNPNLKRQGGMIGLITANTVSRTSEYANLVRLALGLWRGQNWTNNLPTL